MTIRLLRMCRTKRELILNITQFTMDFITFVTVFIIYFGNPEATVVIEWSLRTYKVYEILCVTVLCRRAGIFQVYGRA